MNWLQWFRALFSPRSGAGQPPTLPNSSSRLKPSLTSAPNITPKQPSEAKASEWRADERSERNIATLEPVTAKLAREHLRRLASEGLNFKVTSGTRTFAEQNALFAKGRTQGGSKVTNARAGQSWHNYGVAYDITLFSGKNPIWDSPKYDRAGEVGRELGLEWGGDWKRFKDRPHFQRPLGLTLAQARAKYPGGRVV